MYRAAIFPTGAPLVLGAKYWCFKSSEGPGVPPPFWCVRVSVCECVCVCVRAREHIGGRTRPHTDVSPLIHF